MIITRDELNTLLETEFTEDQRCDLMYIVARDYLKDKVYYLAMAKSCREDNNIEEADEYEARAMWVEERFLKPLRDLVGNVKISLCEYSKEDADKIIELVDGEYLDYDGYGEEE